MQKIKVIHLIHQLGSGGAENGILNIANNINTNVFQIAVCAFSGNGSQTTRLMRNRSELFEFDKRTGNDVTIPIKLFKLFKEWKPDIVHTHGWGTIVEGIVASKLARVPYIIHGEHGTIQNKNLNVALQRVFWRLTDHVLSVSRRHAAELAETIGFDSKRITVIANGVDTNQFFPGDEESLRTELGVRKEDVAIGTVGRLVPVKNQNLLLKAFSVLASWFPNLKLIFVGDGPLMKDLERLSQQLGCSSSVYFLGMRSDIPRLMRAMDIFALTSDSEGMSNTLLESMSSGIPVVATAVGGNTELVINHTTGILIEPNDTAGLIKALGYLITSPHIRKSMGESGRKRTETHYSLPKMVTNYEQLYLGCLTKRATA